MNRLIPVLFVFFICFLKPGSKLSIGSELPGDTIIVNSGENVLIIPGINTWGLDTNSDITFTVSSSDESIVKTNEIAFTTGDNLALLHTEEQGNTGTATITIEADDGNTNVNKSFPVTVQNYDKEGLKFEIHDAIFWQEVIPLKSDPAFDTIIGTSEAPYDELTWDNIPITVNLQCENSPPCTGHDFFTGFFKGYLVPPATGEYTFYFKQGNDGGVWLSQNSDFIDAEVIIMKSDKKEQVGSDIGNNEWTSAPVQLTANQIYAIYATQWVVHDTYGGILWEGPGIEKDYIDGQHLMYIYDPEPPSRPKNVQLLQQGVDFLRVSWDEASDNENLVGYNVYLDGYIQNDAPVQEEIFNIEGLSSETTYSIAVSAVDEMGNESTPSDILTINTFQIDNTPPSPPDNLEVMTQTGIALKVTWSGAVDNETSVTGYNLYLNDELYNTEQIIFEEEAIIKVLAPETEYTIQLKAIDAGNNISEKSQTFSVKTTAFSPDDEDLGVKTGRFNIHSEAVTYSHGIGINADYKNGKVFNNTHDELLKDFQPGAIRWGALTANPLNFSDFIGGGKDVTFAKFMNLCNEHNAYTVICCGVKNSTDWRKNKQTFKNFIEYLNGPQSSTYGKKRAEEGFSEPLLQNSPGLIFEFGNEVWGGESHYAEIGKDYTEYGEWCREMASLMKSSEYYDPDRIFLVYSGRYPDPSYGINHDVMENDRGEVEWVAFSGYLGGNLNYDPAIDPGKSELDYFKNGFEACQKNITGLNYYLKTYLDMTGKIKKSYFYESNMTTPTFNRRLGQALVCTDYFLNVIEHGSAVPTIFHLTGGQWRITEPTQDYERLPLFQTAKFVNIYCKGLALKTEYETQYTISNSKGRILEYKPVGAYAYSKDDQHSIVLISRDFENDHYVQLNLPDDLSFDSNATQYTITGQDYSTVDETLDSATINLSDNMIIKVSKYSMVLISYTGNNQQFDALPLAYYGYKKQESVTIEPEDAVINSNKGKVDLKFKTGPEDALAESGWWDVVENDVNAEVEEIFSYLRIRGSGECEGNGQVVVRAYAVDDSTIYDEIVIDISNQGEDCNTGMNNELGNALKLYPNPADNYLQIQFDDFTERRIEIRSIEGNLIYSGTFYNKKVRLSTESLNQGIYLLRIKDRNSITNQIFLKK